MKIESTPKIDFTPIEIKITIESKRELDALCDISTLNVSIPKLVCPAKRGIIEEFLNGLDKQLELQNL